MKKILFMMSFLCFAMISVQAQRDCGSMEYLQQQMQDNPERIKDLKKIDNHARNFDVQASERNVVTIPVVVHVVYRTATENISDDQIQSQLDVLNDDFRRLNSDATTNWSQAADAEIEFCLATVDPNGNATTGITRTSTSVNGFGTNDAVKFNSQGGKDAWPRDDYLNFWVCNIGGGILGYAQFPGGPAATDGVVNGYQYTGTIGTASAPFDLGRTATHEVGHWLNLRHIWGDGACGVDDFVSDTPQSDAPNYGCATGHSSCGSTDMVENYMDYSDDSCMNLFTQGQKTRMQALFGPGGSRVSLLSSNGCGAGASPTCDDGLQNGNETGVDCGGPDCAACPTCDDGVQNGNETGVDCGGSCNACVVDCNDNAVTVSITLDNYPEETSWQITTANGSVVANGGTYASQPDGSTVEVELCLADGCFDFTINDTYGDGICCSYGNGSYAVTSGGVNLASGGTFGSSESTNFCLGGGPNPTCDDGVQNGNETGIDCGGPDCDACPTCDDGIQNGNETDIDCGGSDCDACPTCDDGIQNGDETGVDCGGACADCNTGGGTEELGAHYFETGWDGWSDGGSDCYRYNGSRSWEGNYSIRIRDNSGTASSMTSSGYNMSGYNSVTVEFYFYPNGMESGEDFWLRYNDGTGWETIATYARGVDFNNNSFYSATVTLDAAQYDLVDGGKFRFTCDASANSDRIYIDQVTITGNGSGNRVSNTVTQLHSLSNAKVVGTDGDISISPNPASNQIYITAEEHINKISIYASTGQLVYQENNLKGFENNIDVSVFTAGVYFISIDTEEEVITDKFIKQ